MKIKPAKVTIRFRDCDLLGHVNNAVYLNYFEQARLHYFGKLLGTDWDYTTQGMVLVKNEVEYLKPVYLNEQFVEILLTLDEIGHKSFTLSYKVTVKDELRSTGKSTLVCIDGKTHKSVPVFTEFREALEQINKKYEDT